MSSMMLCPGDLQSLKPFIFCFHGVCSLVEMIEVCAAVINICKK